MPCGVFKPRSLRSSAGVRPQEVEAFFIPNFSRIGVTCLSPPSLLGRREPTRLSGQPGELCLLRQWEHPCDVHPLLIVSIDFHVLFDAQLTSSYLEHLHCVLNVFDSDMFDSNIVKLVVTSDIENA